MKDFKQQELCDNCWNGMHYYRWEFSNLIGHPDPIKVVSSKHATGWLSNCLRGNCQCPCVQLMSERNKLIEPDHSQQMKLIQEEDNVT